MQYMIHIMLVYILFHYLIFHHNFIKLILYIHYITFKLVNFYLKMYLLHT